MSRRSRGAACLAALTLAGLSNAHAGDLTVVRERPGSYVAYAFGEAGFHRHELGLTSASRVELGEGLGRVSKGRLELLVGASAQGVVTRRIDQELGNLQAFRMGARLALAQGRHGWVAYGVTEGGIAARSLPGTLSVAQVSGDLAWVLVDSAYGLLAATSSGV